MSTDALVNSIHQASNQLRKTAAVMREAYSSIEAVNEFISKYLELESRNEQGAGKPQRSVAEVLADEAARTSGHVATTDDKQRDAQFRAQSIIGDRCVAQIWLDDLIHEQLKKEYEEALVEKYKKQGLVFDEPQSYAPTIGDRVSDPTDLFDEAWARIDKKLTQEMLVNDPWKEPLVLKANANHLPKLDAQSLNNEDCVSDPWDELKTRDVCLSKPNDEQVKRQNLKSKGEALQDAIALSKAFSWVNWQVVQPNKLNGDYRNRNLDIRYDNSNYVVYYAGNCYSFPKSDDLSIASQHIKTRIGWEFPRNKCRIQTGY